MSDSDSITGSLLVFFVYLLFLLCFGEPILSKFSLDSVFRSSMVVICCLLCFFGGGGGDRG